MRRRFICSAFVGVLVIAAALSATTGGATPILRHGPMHRITNSSSSNWSGYAVTGSRFTSVSASWTEPTARCSGTAYSSFWVGLDGDTSNTVEQTGTDADCSGSAPQYYAWDQHEDGEAEVGQAGVGGGHRRGSFEQRRRPAARELRHRELQRRQRERLPAHQQHPAHRPNHDAVGLDGEGSAELHQQRLLLRRLEALLSQPVGGSARTAGPPPLPA